LRTGSTLQIFQNLNENYIKEDGVDPNYGKILAKLCQSHYIQWIYGYADLVINIPGKALFQCYYRPEDLKQGERHS
jgi:hypothetical protein